MDRIEKLLKFIDAIERAGDPGEITQAAQSLKQFLPKITIWAMSLAQQEGNVLLASQARDRATLKAYVEHSQYPDIRAWAKEALQP